jgi:hypothetical protein
MCCGTSAPTSVCSQFTLSQPIASSLRYLQKSFSGASRLLFAEDLSHLTLLVRNNINPHSRTFSITARVRRASGFLQTSLSKILGNLLFGVHSTWLASDFR